MMMQSCLRSKDPCTAIVSRSFLDFFRWIHGGFVEHVFFFGVRYRPQPHGHIYGHHGNVWVRPFQAKKPEGTPPCGHWQVSQKASKSQLSNAAFSKTGPNCRPVQALLNA